MKTLKKVIASSLAALTLTGCLMTASFADTYYPKYKGSSFSLVDGLKAVGADSSRDNRNAIAKLNGIKDYEGTAEQNLKLLDLLKNGKLVKKKSASYKITYNANGGKSAPAAVSVKAGSSVKLSAKSPVRTGYVFLGWSSSATAAKAEYKAGKSYTPKKNVTMYAVWKVDPDAVIRTLKFSANSGTGAPKSIKAPENASVNIPAVTPVREGYRFLGWSKRKNAAEARFTKHLLLTGDITLYAVWDPIIYYTLTYDANGGENAPEPEVLEEMKASPLSTVMPTRKGYSFLGWDRKANAVTPGYFSDSKVKLGRDRTIYAVWMKHTGKKSLVTHKTYDISVANKARLNQPHYTNTADKRSTDAYNAVIDQFLVDTNPRYAITNGYTFCNIFAWDVCTAMEATLPHWVRDKYTPAEPYSKNAFETSVNILSVWLEDHGEQYGWKKVTAAEAQTSADEGHPTVAIWKNPTGESGHIAVVRPQGKGYFYSEKNGCVIAQAGSLNFSYGNVITSFMEERMSEIVYWTAP